MKLPPGFRLELVAAEPVIRQPSGVGWDAHGNLFVSELHGYNREGQFDIEELNKTGKLDRVVRRIAANDDAMRRAEAEQHGTVKRLIDDDDDGVMDRAEVWADRLPACLGICPARGGVIAICAPDIVFLADRDGDGVPNASDTCPIVSDPGQEDTDGSIGISACVLGQRPIMRCSVKSRGARGGAISGCVPGLSPPKRASQGGGSKRSWSQHGPRLSGPVDAVSGVWLPGACRDARRGSAVFVR